MIRNYELIDFGHGRKLESLDGYVVDRPSPAAEIFPCLTPAAWDRADAAYDLPGHRKQWQFRRAWPEVLQLDCTYFRMPLQPKPYGHIGIFPEHAASWQWVHDKLQGYGTGAAALNLFAYTGAGSLAMATAGAVVTHVDASKPAVNAAKAAAGTVQPEPTIRFLVDDALKFCQREIRRGRAYRLIMLDPPSYGHGPKGQTWRVERDLWPLLDCCSTLLDRSGPCALHISGHSPGAFAEQIARYVRQQNAARLRIEHGRSVLSTPRGRSLDCGYWLRVEVP